MFRLSSLYRLWIMILLMGIALEGLGQSVDPNNLVEEIRMLKARVNDLESQLEVYKSGTSQQPLQDLDQPIRIIQRERELELEAAAEKEKNQPVVHAGKQGFSLKSPQGDFSLRARGGFQFDSRFLLDDEDEQGADSFYLRRVRPRIEGTVFDDYDFVIQIDFAEGKSDLLDAYLNIGYWEEFQIRAGKMKAPMGLERLQSWPNLAFIERGFPTQILQNRDLGVQVQGVLLDGSLDYALGVFNGVADNSSSHFDTEDGKDIDARLFTHPFLHSGIESLKGLGVGISGSIGDYEGNLASYSTPGRARFFNYSSGTVADGNQIRYSPQGYYYYGPFGFLGEYAVSIQDVEKGTLQEEMQNEAWQVYMTYVLTGEEASYRGVKPKRPFHLSEGDWGAFELAARYGHLEIDDAVFALGLSDPALNASEADEWTLGLNWYLNDNFKVNLNYSHTEFEQGTLNGDRDSEDALITRFQIVF